jgi:DNA-directed RNA polymerase beta' subunit
MKTERRRRKSGQLTASKRSANVFQRIKEFGCFRDAGSRREWIMTTKQHIMPVSHKESVNAVIFLPRKMPI